MVSQRIREDRKVIPNAVTLDEFPLFVNVSRQFSVHLFYREDGRQKRPLPCNRVGLLLLNFLRVGCGESVQPLVDAG
jgi:hypothetical protein